MGPRRALSRVSAVAIVAWVAIGGASGVASAHAEFQSTRVTAGSTTTVSLDVPHERAPNVYNTIVRVQVPDGWSSPSCAPARGWSCSTMPGEVAFSKNDPSSIVDATEMFSFAVTAPTATGTSVFPVVQIYNTGENVLWSSSAQLEVVAGPSPSTTSPAPTTTVTSASTTTSSTTTASSSTSSTTGPTTTVDSGATTSSSGGSSLPIVVVLVVLVLAAGGATVVLVRRRGH